MPVVSVPAAARRLLAIAACLALTAGCSAAQSADPAATTPSAGQATLTNCSQQTTYTLPVSRIVATSNSANIGTLLRVGARDQIAAMALKPGNDQVFYDLYGSDVSAVPRLDSPISLEAILATGPDLLIGSYSGLFSGSTGVTTQAANDKGIPTYVISDSCRQDPAAGSSSKLGTMDPWDAVRADVTNYGTLTGHTTEAGAALTELNTRLAALTAAPAGADKPKVLLFDSGTADLYTSGHNGPPQGIMDAAGATNVFASEDTTWFRASWEAVAAAKPDAIVVMDYRSGTAGEVSAKIATLRSQAALKDLPAITQNRIIVLPLALFTSGYPNIEAAEQVRAGLEGFGLLPTSGITGTLPASYRQVP